MAEAAQYRTEHVAETPRGYRIASFAPGPKSEHVVRVAFPPGRRKKGSGKLVEILHPISERNPKCEISRKARKNPSELLIFGNPSACRGKGNPSKLEAQRATRERAAKIRAARLNPQRANPRRRRKDRNPDETKQAVKLFQAFHGKDPKGIAEAHVSAAMRKDYAALGDLDYLQVRTPLGDVVKFEFGGDGIKLASSPDGKQLYCIGGKQDLSACLHKDSLQHDFIDVGECLEVQYIARKIHGNYEPVSYFHKFGEETGGRPRLMFDRLKKAMFFIGGEYFIQDSGGISPGIEN